VTSVVEEKPSAVTSVAEEIRIMPMTTKETNAGRRRGRKHPHTHQTESLQFLLEDGHSSSPPLPPAVDVDVDAAVPRNRGNRSRKQTAGNTCGATSSSSSKRRGKPSTPTLSSDPRVVRALEEAEYEAGVDPYRGMAPFFSLTNAIDNNNDDDENRRCGGAIDDDRMEEEEEKDMGGGGGVGKVGVPPMISERPLRSSTDSIGREWACERCTLLNSCRNANCEACGASRRAAVGSCGIRGRTTIDDIDNDDDDNDEFRGGGGKYGEVGVRRRVYGHTSVPSLSSSSSSSSGFAIDDGIEHSRNVHSRDSRDALVDPDDAGSPWMACRDAIFVVTGGDDGWSFRNVGRGREGWNETTTHVVDVDADDVDVVVIDHDEEWRGRGEGGTIDDGAAILVKCGCPTVDGWAVAELEAYNKRLVADAKRTAKRKRGGDGGRGAVVTSNESGRGKRDDDDSTDKSQNDRHGHEYVDSAPSTKAQLICGTRKHDAGTLHPCDFNPVS
jgi:hypothetical protein